MTSEIDKHKLSALFQVLKATSRISAQAVFYVSAIGAISLMVASDPSSALNIIAGGIGINLLSNIIERISQGHDVSDEEIQNAVQKAIEDTDIADSLTSDEFQRDVAKLVRQQEHLKFAIEHQEYVLANLLSQQYEQYTVFLEELQPEIAAIHVHLQTLATHEQGEQIIALLDRINNIVENIGATPKPSWNSLLTTSVSQVLRTIQGLSRKYQQELYVARETEAVFEQFTQSDKVCLTLVDRAGCGKTNLLCALASKSCEKGQLVLLLRGDSTLEDDHGLERLICEELGYVLHTTTSYHSCLQEISQLAKQHKNKLYIFIDGISEADDIRKVTRSLRNLLIIASELGAIQICITCRDVTWPIVEFDLPDERFFFPVKPLTGILEVDKASYRLQIGDFTETELDSALPLYSEKFHVFFTPRHAARQNLRHPLLLRLFCEANQHQALGYIDAIPRSSTFDHYLEVKSSAIETKTGGYFSRAHILATLISLAGRLQLSTKGKRVMETEVEEVYPKSISQEDGRQLLDLLVEEGVVTFYEQRFLAERGVRFVFSELQDYLFLKHIVSHLPQSLIRESPDIVALGTNVLGYYGVEGSNQDVFLLLQLIGMALPEVNARRDFMRALLHWDFQTYCGCLIRISATGKLAQCDVETLKLLAGELCWWFKEITTTQFPLVQSQIDPWFRVQRTGSGPCADIGIQMQASPGCREISYWYECLSDSAEQIKVTQSNQYPTWRLAISQGDQTIELHDPEHGLMIPILRSGPGDRTQRTIDFSVHPPFPGASFNVPERIALFDIWNELGNFIQNGPIPYEPVPLIVERARAIAKRIPGLEIDPALTLETLQAQIPRLLTQFPEGSRSYVEFHSNWSELEILLTRLNEPLGPGQLPLPDIPSSVNTLTITHENYSDGVLREYLVKLFSIAFGCYRVTVEGNLPGLTKVLVTYASLPCTAVVVTDRKSIRYAFLPEETIEEAKFTCSVVPISELDLSNPLVSFRVSDMPFVEQAWSVLTQMGKNRPPIHPVENIIPIEVAFSATPINDLVKMWLRSDLREVFGF